MSISRPAGLRRCALLCFFVFALPIVLLAGWTTSPPSSGTEGTTVNVAANGTANPGYSVSYLVIWAQMPSGTWIPVATGTGVNLASINCSGSRSLDTPGTWNWTVRLQTSGPSGSPSGTQLASGTTTVNPAVTPTTFNFGNLTHTYDGSSKTATVTPSPGNATYSSDLTKGPGAGSYTVSATANGSFSGSGSATLTINKANQATLTLNASTSQQFGTSQTLSASGGSGGGAVSYVITGQSAGGNATLSGATLTANASSGWVDVRADKAADANYNATSSSAVRIYFALRSTSFGFGNLTHTYDGSTKTATVTPSPSNATYSYDLTKGPSAGSYTVSATANGNYSGSGSATLTISTANQAALTLNASTTQQFETSQTLSASGGSGGGAISYVITGQSAGGNVTLSGATLTANASTGWVDVRADKAADANYNATSSAVVRVYLAARTTTFNFGNLSHAYDGSSKTATVTPSPGNATYSYDLTKGPNAGSYTVSATANGNFSGSGSATLTISMVNQAALTLNATSTQQFETSQALSASGGSGSGAISYVITGQSAGGNASLSGATLTANASSGWVDVRADKAADANYNATSSAAVRVNLAARTTTFSLSNLSHTYDGSSKTATVTPSPGNATYSSDLTKGPGAGSYTVSVTANGNFSGSSSATLTINKANQATLTLNASTSQQFGTSQTLSTSGGSGGGTVGYVITGQSAGGNATLSGATLTANANTGWVDVRADKAADANYNATSSAVVRITMAANAATFIFGNLTHTYDGASKTATVTPTPSNATYTSDLTKGPGAGSYTVSAAANGNYSGSGSATLTINKANQPTLTLSASTTLQYGGSQALSTSGGSGSGGVSYVITGQSAAGNVTLAGTTLTANASSGWVDVRADKAADANYNAASSAAVRINLAVASTTFGFGNLSHTYDGTAKTATVTPTPSGATFSSDLTKGPGAGNHTVTATANGNYSGSGSATLVISKAAPGSVFAARTLSAPAATGGFPVRSSDLNAVFTAVGSGTTPTGAATYSVVSASGAGASPTSGAVSTSTVFTLGTYTIRASYPGDGNYLPATIDAVWTVIYDPNADYDGDGLSNHLESLLGTNPTSSNSADSSNTNNLKIHRPAQ